MPRPAQERTIAIAIMYPVVAGAKVEVQDAPDHWLEGVTNEDGYVAWQCPDSLGDSTVKVTKEGFQPYEQHCHWRNLIDNPEDTPPLNHQLTIGVDLPPLQAEHHPPVIPPFIVVGPDFVGPGGQRIVWTGIDGQYDLRLWIDGGSEALDPFMGEGMSLGFNLRRIFCMSSIKQNGIADLYPQRVPGYFDKLRALVDYQNGVGIVPLITAMVDAQDVMPDQGEQVEFCHQVYEALNGTTYFFSGGNQYDKNGFDPLKIPTPPAGVPWSRGSATTEKLVPLAGALAGEYHPRRDMPKSLDDAVASMTEMTWNKGYSMVWLTEPKKWSDDGSEKEAWWFGRIYATLWALAVFHNPYSQAGRLMSEPVRRMAAAWSAGMVIGR